VFKRAASVKKLLAGFTLYLIYCGNDTFVAAERDKQSETQQASLEIAGGNICRLLGDLCAYPHYLWHPFLRGEYRVDNHSDAFNAYCCPGMGISKQLLALHKNKG
jgi:hypothetical protein